MDTNKIQENSKIAALELTIQNLRMIIAEKDKEISNLKKEFMKKSLKGLTNE